MVAYLQSGSEEITEYSKALVSRMIERITVYDTCFVVEFKSGIKITINEYDENDGVMLKLWSGRFLLYHKTMEKSKSLCYNLIRRIGGKYWGACPLLFKEVLP